MLSVSRMFKLVVEATNIPGGRSVEGLCGVVITFSMSAHEENFVFDIVGALTIELGEFIVKSLPLGQLTAMVRIGIISLIDETEIDGGLVELAGIGARSTCLILHSRMWLHLWNQDPARNSLPRLSTGCRKLRLTRRASRRQ